MNYRSIEDVARDLNLSIKAVRRYVASGELRAVKRKNVYKITEEDFEAFKKLTGWGFETTVDKREPTTLGFLHYLMPILAAASSGKTSVEFSPE